MEFSDVSPNEWVGVTINASSTEDFLKQLKNTNYEGKDLNGHLVNVDFKKVEEELKDKSPTLGHIFCEDCNFIGCEIVNPYKRGHLSSSCKTDGMEHIKKQLKFLEEDGLHPVVSYTPDNGSLMSSSKYNISVVDNKGELFTKFDMTFWGSADVDVNGAFNSSLVSDIKRMEDYFINGKYEWLNDDIKNGKDTAVQARDKEFERSVLRYKLIKNDNPEKIKFETKEDCLSFLEFMAKRAESLAKENYNGNEKHWNFQAETFRKESETMKHPFYTLERCNTRMNHPSFEPNRLVYIQQEAWMAKNVREKESVIKREIYEYNKLVKEQNTRDAQYMGFGKLVERVFNRKEFSARENAMKAISKEMDGNYKSLDSFVQNGRAMFNRKLWESFLTWKDSGNSKKDDRKDVIDLSVSVEKTKQHGKEM